MMQDERSGRWRWKPFVSEMARGGALSKKSLEPLSEVLGHFRCERKPTPSKSKRAIRRARSASMRIGFQSNTWGQLAPSHHTPSVLETYWTDVCLRLRYAENMSLWARRRLP